MRRGDKRRAICRRASHREISAEWCPVFSVCRRPTSAQGADLDVAVVDTGSGVYLLTRLIEQQKAAAKKETGGDADDKSDGAEIEQDGDRNPH